MKIKSLLLCLAFALISHFESSNAQELSQELGQIVGTWQTEREIEGNKAHYVMEIKKDSTFKFWLKGAEDQVTYMYAEGKLKISKSGPFKMLRLYDLMAGQKEEKDTLQKTQFERNYVFQTGYKKLFLAANFDADRENEAPEVMKYKKIK